MSDFDLHRWFGPDELERCPVCSEAAGVRLPASASFVCLGCGHLITPGSEKSGSSVEPRQQDM
jgi:hypothetical protein